MASYNRVLLMGNLTRNPEVRYTPSGTAVADLGLAVNESYKDKAGEKHESTVFVDVVVWGRTAEVIAEYFQKGSPIFIEGRLQFDEWENQQGEKRTKLRVRADKFEFIGKGEKKTESTPHNAQTGSDKDVPADFNEFEDDIPF